ncbi:MAG: DNA translocase FtsK 4TM domain-containing protein, partial [Hydrogenovibrio sp.]|nr:DNA translocase FtsK 4TM domain-containing protein [Hydrogenovibrio sp.]
MPNYFKKPSSEASETEENAQSSASFQWVLKDAIVLACIGLSFFLFLVLFSYHATDPGFETASTRQDVLNYGGHTGAWIASLLLYLFGIFGFLVPFGIFMAGMVTLKIRAGTDTDFVHFGLSMAGLILLIVSGSALSSLFLHPDMGFIQLPYSGGGVLGYEVSKALVDSVDLLGATLVLLVLFAIAFSMFTSLSWLSIIDYTGLYTWKLLSKLSPYLQQVTDATKQKMGASAEGRSAQEGALLIRNDDDKPKPKAVGKLAEKVKAKTQSVFEINKKEIPSLASENQPNIDLDSATGSTVKVGKKATANISAPVHNSGALPSIDLLNPVPEYDEGFSSDELTSLSLLLEQRLQEFGVSIKVEAVQPGPVVTRFEVLPAAGV